jgi:hypothetical protein
MRTSSQSSISPAITRTLATTIIAVILVGAHFTVIDAQQPPQQQSLQSGRDGGLTATINSGSFTTGETITISGSVQQRGTSSNVIIEITDPQGQLVKRGFPSLSVTGDNTFSYSFVAGEQEQFDTNAPMIASGNYLVKVRYFPPSDGVVIEEVELSFVYNGATTNAIPTSSSVNSSSITDSGAGAAQASSLASTSTSVTSSSSPQGEVQSGTAMTTAATAALVFMYRKAGKFMT